MTDAVDVAWTYLHAGEPVPDEVVALLRADGSGRSRCALLAYQRGRPEVTRVDVDAWAGAIPADQPERAAVAFRVAHAYLALGLPSVAAAVAAECAEGADVELVGALGLVRAVALADAGEPESALELLDGLPVVEQSAMVDSWHTEYGSGNVAAHRIAVLAQLGRFDEAFALLGDPGLQVLSVERRRHVVADLAACL